MNSRGGSFAPTRNVSPRGLRRQEDAAANSAWPDGGHSAYDNNTGGDYPQPAQQQPVQMAPQRQAPPPPPPQQQNDYIPPPPQQQHPQRSQAPPPPEPKQPQYQPSNVYGQPAYQQSQPAVQQPQYRQPQQPYGQVMLRPGAAWGGATRFTWRHSCIFHLTCCELANFDRQGQDMRRRAAVWLAGQLVQAMLRPPTASIQSLGR